MALNGACGIIDVSRKSTKIIAPLCQSWMHDSTFVSTIRIKPQIAFLSVKVFWDLAIGKILYRKRITGV
jgi:hypothetical protein